MTCTETLPRSCFSSSHRQTLPTSPSKLARSNGQQNLWVSGLTFDIAILVIQLYIRFMTVITLRLDLANRFFCLVTLVTSLILHFVLCVKTSAVSFTILRPVDGVATTILAGSEPLMPQTVHGPQILQHFVPTEPEKLSSYWHYFLSSINVSISTSARYIPMMVGFITRLWANSLFITLYTYS